MDQKKPGALPRRPEPRLRDDISSFDPQFLSSDVVYLLQMLQNSGHSAYVVGGCVRDWMLGFTRSQFLDNHGDYDITTSATVDEMIELFNGQKLILDGIAFGTVKVYINNKIHEITTFRVEGSYRDGRHPEEIIYSDVVEDDLSRRDFTINAMAANLAGEVVDPFEGYQDLRTMTLRTVGNPYDRFAEDYLRMLRAVRLSVMLRFQFDPITYRAILRIQHEDPKIFNEAVSSERIFAELKKALSYNSQRSLILFYELQLFLNIFYFFQFKDQSLFDFSGLASILSQDHSVWYLEMVKILKYIDLTEPSTSLFPKIASYLKDLAMPRIDREHILILLGAIPVSNTVTKEQIGDRSLQFWLDSQLRKYRTPENYEQFFLEDVQEIHNSMFPAQKISKTRLDRLKTLAKFGKLSDVEVFVDGNLLHQRGYQGKILGLIIDELRLYQPSNREEAWSFVNFLTSEREVTKEEVIDQLEINNDPKLVNHIVNRRRRIKELILQQ